MSQALSRPVLLFGGLLLAGAAVAMGAPPAATGAKKPTPRAAAPAAAASEKVAYENLHGYLGDRITVRSKFGTTRTGVLARFTNTELTLTIDTPSGSTELSMPKDTIVEILAAPAQK